MRKITAVVLLACLFFMPAIKATAAWGGLAKLIGRLDPKQLSLLFKDVDPQHLNPQQWDDVARILRDTPGLGDVPQFRSFLKKPEKQSEKKEVWKGSLDFEYKLFKVLYREDLLEGEVEGLRSEVLVRGYREAREARDTDLEELTSSILRDRMRKYTRLFYMKLDVDNINRAVEEGMSYLYEKLLEGFAKRLPNELSGAEKYFRRWVESRLIDKYRIEFRHRRWYPTLNEQEALRGFGDIMLRYHDPLLGNAWRDDEDIVRLVEDSTPMAVDDLEELIRREATRRISNASKTPDVKPAWETLRGFFAESEPLAQIAETLGMTIPEVQMHIRMALQVLAEAKWSARRPSLNSDFGQMSVEVSVELKRCVSKAIRGTPLVNKDFEDILGVLEDDGDGLRREVRERLKKCWEESVLRSDDTELVESATGAVAAGG